MKYITTLLLFFITASSFAQILNPRYFFYERTPCFGKCPSYRVEVLSNGVITYVGKRNVERIGTFKAKLSLAQRKQVLKAFNHYKLPAKSATNEKLASDLPSLNYGYEIKKKRYTQINVNENENGIAALIDAIITEINDWKQTLPSEENETKGKEFVTGENPLTTKEQMPEFQGGQSAMMAFIQKNLQYPAMAVEDGIEGKVIVGFTINEQGAVTNTLVQKSVHPLLDKEAIRIIKSMPLWKPGKQNGKIVSCNYNLPINFNLTK
jgi:TonB family protein